MKLSLKITLLFISVAVLLAGGGGLFIFFNTRSLLRTEFGRHHLINTGRLMDAVDIFLHERLQDVQVIGQAPPFFNALTRPEEGENVKQAQLRLKQLFDTTGPWDQLLIVDNNGKVVFRVVDSNIKQITGQTPVLEKAFKSGLEGKFYYSDAVISDFTGRPTVLISYPVRNGFEINSPVVGVAVAELSWSAVLDILARVPGADRSVFLFNSDGWFLGASDGRVSEILKTRKDDRSIFYKNLTSGIEKNEVGIGVFSGESALSSYVLEKGYLNFSGNGWMMLVEYPLAAALAEARGSALSLALALAFALIASFLVFYILFRRVFIAPIVYLTEIAEKISSGNLDVKPDKRFSAAKNEIGLLARTLEIAAANLKKLYQNLDQEVKERTKALEHSESELQVALDDARRLNNVMINRELKMIELKKELNNLKKTTLEE